MSPEEVVRALVITLGGMLVVIPLVAAGLLLGLVRLVEWLSGWR